MPGPRSALQRFLPPQRSPPMLKALHQPQFLLLCGLSAVLVSCTGESQDSNNRSLRFVSIQPIQVCDDGGLICADLALFEAATRKIWAQAGLDISFLNPNRLNATRFLTIDSQDEFAEISFAGGAGAFGRHPLSTSTTGPINLWFVEDIFPLEGFDTLGLAWINRNGTVISDDILSFNNGIGRLDTVAHEIGHNLGLTHGDFGAGGTSNLMTEGFFRNSPTDLDQITPDGARLDQLSNTQIEVARDSSLTRPSPALGGDSPRDLPSSLPPLSDATADALPRVGGGNPAIDSDRPLFDGPLEPLPGGITEATPIAYLALQPEASFAPAAAGPQPIPNGRAMTWLTAVLLAGYLGWQPRRR